MAVDLERVLTDVHSEDERSILQCLLTEFAVNQGFRVLRVGKFLYCTRKIGHLYLGLVEQGRRSTREESRSEDHEFQDFLIRLVRFSLDKGDVNSKSRSRGLSADKQALITCLKEPSEAYAQVVKINHSSRLHAKFMFEKLLTSYVSHYKNELTTKLSLTNVLSLAADEAFSELSYVCKRLGFKVEIPAAQTESDLINQVLSVKANYLVKFWEKIYALRQFHKSLMIANQEVHAAQSNLLEKMTNVHEEETKTKLKTKYEILNGVNRLKEKLSQLHKSVGWKYKQSIINETHSKLSKNADPSRISGGESKADPRNTALPKQPNNPSPRYLELMSKISIVDAQIALRQQRHRN